MQVSNLVFCAKLIFLQDECNRYFHLFLDIKWVFVQFFFIKKVLCNSDFLMGKITKAFELFGILESRQTGFSCSGMAVLETSIKKIV